MYTLHPGCGARNSLTKCDACISLKVAQFLPGTLTRSSSPSRPSCTLNLHSMTKLQRKIQQGAKKRSHKKTVDKRKKQRQVKSMLERRIKAEITDGHTKTAASDDCDDGDDGPEVAATTTAPSSDVGCRDLDHIDVGDIGRLRQKGPQMTRKQMRRKMKGISRGEAVTAVLQTKLLTKLSRVRHRAQVRNMDLHD